MFNTVKDASLEAVTALLAFFYQLPIVGDSYGIAIMLLTATVMILLMPLTIKATRSTIKMTQLQPELRALQKKYKDDKAELNPAMMALYQENGVNPVGGCLPMLAQLPVFLILFNVLRGLTRRISEKPYYTVSDRAHELVGADIANAQTFDPKYLDRTTELYQDLHQTTEMKFLGVFDLADAAGDVVRSNFLGSIPYIVLIIFVVGTSYFQQRQVSARRGSVPDNPTPQQQTQQQLLRILPLMSGVWSFFFPAGLVLYWATSNVFRIGQQAYITRALYADDAADPLSKVDDEPDDADTEPLVGDGKPAKSAGKGAGSQSKKKSGATSAQNGAGSNGRKSGGRSSAGKSNGDKADSSGDRSGSSGRKADRNEAWAQRRAQRSDTQTRKRAAADGSSRTTPKGTKPAASKKKRKR